jgi:phosphoribosylformylglycinamidine cyclo-ligase
MCVNDVLVQGAEPLFFLDYFACGKLQVDVATAVIAGIADGCELAGAALIGGETAEMPDMYADGEYDLAGFCVGVVERSEMIDGQAIAVGDAIIGLRSSGPHSNGYSLIRRVLERAGDKKIEGQPAAEALLAPTRIYVRSILALMTEIKVHGLAHITGGGITENLPRVFPDGLGAAIDTTSWEQGPVFDWLAENGNIAIDEMRRTFNCGIGMAIIVAAEDVNKSIELLEQLGESAFPIGSVIAGANEVSYR